MKVEEARLAADLKVKEARIAAELSALEHEKDVAAATAEAEVLEAAVELERREGSHDVGHVTIQLTRDYVELHSQQPPRDAEPPELKPYSPSLLPLIKPNVQSHTQVHAPGLDSRASHFLAKNDVHAAQQPETATPVVCQHTTRV